MHHIMKFRSLQAFSIVTVFAYWLVRFASDPHHMHKTMLIMSAVVALVSEVSYRAGKAEETSKPAKRTVA